MKSKRVGKPVFIVLVVLIAVFTYLAFFGADNYYGDRHDVYVKGASDIRWGIDISGGVEAVFSPELGKGQSADDITNEDMDAAKETIELRLISQNVTDYEIYVDNNNNQIIVRFPWAANESNFDAQETIDSLGTSAILTFYNGDDNSGTSFMTGKNVESSTYAYGPYSDDGKQGWYVSLKLDKEGAAAFATATSKAAANKTNISIYMDDQQISKAGCSQAITDGNAIIYGEFTEEAAKALSDRINAGALPFSLSSDDSKLQIVSPTLGENALNVMLIAGAIAFGVVALLMIIRYRVHGVVATIALLGQLVGSIACISGFFPDVDSFTLTIPGIAGIILSIGVGVDCNVISAERIRDEFQKGKTIDGAIDSGFKNSLSAVIDGNVTIVIVSLVLMGAFGSPDSFMAKIFSPVMSLFGTSITGAIYSFGYTLLVGVIFNLIMGVLASKYMLKSVSQFKFLRNPAFYGGKKNG